MELVHNRVTGRRTSSSQATCARRREPYNIKVVSEPRNIPARLGLTVTEKLLGTCEVSVQICRVTA
jgi:hypothetical protein